MPDRFSAGAKFVRDRWPLILSICLTLFTIASPAVAAESAKQLLAVVDYIAGDYRNAVQAGKVVNPDEYQEMLEFSTRSLELLARLKQDGGTDVTGIEKDLTLLAAHVKAQSGETEVAKLAQRIKERLIASYHIITYPKVLSSFQAGRSVYRENCAQCHGPTGRGDGPGISNMEPKEPRPANFHDADLMNGLSPFKAFNTTSFGIQGTAMPNFSALTEDERWQAAFYVMSLRFSAEQSDAGKTLFKATKVDRLAANETLATRTDAELKKELNALYPGIAEVDNVLAYLRRGLLEESKSDPLLLARTYLREALELYEQGRRPEAYQKAVDAYLDGFELAEPALFAKDAAQAKQLEARFAEFRALIRSGADTSQIRESHRALETRLAGVTAMLEGKDASSRAYTLLNAALIIIREGMEAALIVAAIIAALRATGSLQAIRFVHLGWLLALASGILTWALAQTVLAVSGAQREVIEGLTALLAALVLFSVSYWLISKAEAKRWQHYIQHKVQAALTTGRIVALVGVSFLAVYREAFETVLFYQALWLQSEATQYFVIWGFLLGAALLAAIVWAIFKLGMRIPLRLFFGISSALLYLLAFVFTGEGIKNLQATGWFSETPLPNAPAVPMLGIYPTLETMLAQSAMVLALIVALLWLWRRTPARQTVRQS